MINCFQSDLFGRFAKGEGHLNNEVDLARVTRHLMEDHGTEQMARKALKSKSCAFCWPCLFRVAQLVDK